MMKIFNYPDKKDWPELLARPAIETGNLDRIVTEVLEDVKKNGDRAILKYTEKFDQVSLKDIEVLPKEIENSINLLSAELIKAINLAAENITIFHKAQIPKPVEVETQPGVKCWQKAVAIEKVGLYIPGGTAPLFSTVLMLALPARIAGCEEIILCSPPDKSGNLNPAILYAASIAGVTRIFKIGGVQAIGALAYGSESVPKVFKIYGPGNQYVTAAKQIVARSTVAIDLPAGPSEVAVLANENSNPEFIAADLLSQAEHGSDSQVILISTSSTIISKVTQEVSKQLDTLPRKIFATNALENSRIFLVNNDQEMMELVNAYAPEHLIISTANADVLAEKVVNAGSVFIGELTPESAGDYASGTNHTLPTNGYARSYSGVNLDSYYKKITFQKINREGLINIGPSIEIMAEAEQLVAHQRAVTLRLQSLKK